MEKSFWYHSIEQTYPALSEDVETEIAIIGGGLAGVTAAYELLSRGHSVCVLEADLVGSGQTGRSSACVSYSHDLIYARLIRKHGKEAAAEYLRANAEAVHTIKSRIERNKIACDWMDCDMYLFTRTKKGLRKLKHEQSAYRKLGGEAVFSKTEELPFPVTAALKTTGHGCMNPYEYLAGLARAVTERGGRIYERTRVLNQPENGRLEVDGHIVTARRFVVATHFPYLNVPGFYFTKMYQSRSHNVAFRTPVVPRHLYEEAEEDGFEYRPVGTDAALSGGGNIRTGTYRHRSQYRIVEESLIERYGAGEKDVLCRFSAQDCMTYDHLPLVGEYGTLEGVYVITGFNKWGFTNSVVSARQLADLLEEKPGVPLYDSRRMYFPAAPLAAAKNMGETVLDYAEDLLSTDAKRLSSIRPGQGAVVRVKGKRLGVYRDEAGGLHTVLAVCPHLGCALKWNKDERSWDCPCHGSRFDADGRLLDGPAMHDAHRVGKP